MNKKLGRFELDHTYCFDCAVLLGELPDECIDLTVTSPPYDDLRTYNGYKFDFEEIARQLYRVTKRGGVVVWVVGDQTKNGSESGSSFQQALSFKEIGFRLHDTMIWNKGTFRYPDATRYHSVFEYMFVLSKGKPKTINLISDRENKYVGSKIARKHQVRYKNGVIKENSAYRKDKDRRISDRGVRHNVWIMSTSKSGSDKISLRHPASFPEALARDHILSWSNPNDIVLDPMCGSGTTLKAALLSGRHYLGFDSNIDYVRLSEERIELARNKPR